jgi:hypothetical protein
MNKNKLLWKNFDDFSRCEWGILGWVVYFQKGHQNIRILKIFCPYPDFSFNLSVPRIGFEN